MQDYNEVKQKPTMVETPSNTVKYTVNTKIWLQTPARPDLNPHHETAQGKRTFKDQNARCKLHEGTDDRNMLEK